MPREYADRIIINEQGQASLSGVDGPRLQVLAQTDRALVTKSPGHRFWVGQGIDQYAKAETSTWEILEDLGPDHHWPMSKVSYGHTYRIRHIITWNKETAS